MSEHVNPGAAEQVRAALVATPANPAVLVPTQDYEPTQIVPQESVPWVSFPVRTEEDVSVVMRALAGGGPRVADHIGEPLALRGVITHEVWLTEEATGDVMAHHRVVLVGVDGTTYEAVSRGLYRSVCQLHTLMRRCGLDWPCTVKVRQIACGAAHRTFALDLVCGGSAGPTKGSKRGKS